MTFFRDNINMSKHWFNNGEIRVLADNCPEGFTAGRLPVSAETREKHRKHNAWLTMTEEQKAARAAKISKTKQACTQEEIEAEIEKPKQTQIAKFGVDEDFLAK